MHDQQPHEAEVVVVVDGGDRKRREMRGGVGKFLAEGRTGCNGRSGLPRAGSQNKPAGGRPDLL